MIGEIFGHYRIVERVASGGFGVVYRARDELLERDVAIKVLPPGMLNDDSSRRNFRREALALAKLNHPNIETVYEFGSQDGVDFLVMEYVPGKTLSDKLAAGPIQQKELVFLATQIVDALQEAHDCGIVHRDLKPANIVITPKGQAKVLDFGLAKWLRPGEELTSDQISDLLATAGTLPYMSPEQLNGELVDARADIYSTGAVLYEMALNRKVFSGPLASQVINAILHQTPLSPRTANPLISPALDSIILKCLDKDPAERYQSAKELLVDLKRITTRSIGAPVSRARPLGSRGNLSLILSGVALLLVLASVMKRPQFPETSSKNGQPPRVQSLAVLPLENLSGDVDQEYFAEGMTEELITQLAQISALRVISRTSVMPYLKSHKPLPEIAKQLEVDAIVEGSVTKSGRRVRITAQLIQASTEKHLWAESYERDLTDVLSLQGEVARDIAREIRVTVTPQEQKRLVSSAPVSVEAHEAYLKGRYHWNKGTEKEYKIARQYFEDASELQQNYAPSLSGLASYFWATDELAPDVAMPRAKGYVQQALAIDDSLSGAHTTLGNIRFNADWDWSGAESEFKRALELNQNDAEAHRAYSVFLSAMGRESQALTEIEVAQRLDPLSLITSVTKGWAYYFARQYDLAIQQCEKTLELDTNYVGAHDCLGAAYMAKGSYEKAIVECQKAAAGSANDPLRTVGLGRAYALSGKKIKARNILKALQENSSHHYVPAYFLATVYVALGHKDQAFSWLGKAYDERDSYLAWLKVDDSVDSLRMDSRFRELLSKIGLPQ
jgi:serine/threonine protein kinase/tetratricopeptide (TPR) repeat protein